MDLLGFLGSIIGGIIGGLFTFLGVRYTIKHENKKARKEELKEAYENRPRLEIKKYRSFKEAKNDGNLSEDCNVLVLKMYNPQIIDNKLNVQYDNKALDIDNLVFEEYEFKNVGLTEIASICVASTAHRNISIIDLDRRNTFFSSNFINYDVWCEKRYIKPGKVVKIRFYYVKDDESNYTKNVLIWLHDINGRYWTQSIEATSNIIENSILKDSKVFRDSIDVDKAEECFKNPYLW